MFHIFLVIAPLFLIIFSAAFLRRVNFITEDWSIHLNQYALKIGLPALVFTSLATMPIAFTDELSLIIENALFIIFILILSYGIGKIFKLSTQMRNTIIICLMFSNVAYLGIPVLTQVYDTEILPQLSIIVAVYLLGLFGLGVAYLETSRRTSSQSVARTIFTLLCTNPLLIAVFAGLICSALHLQVPHVILTALQLITGSVTPIVLIVIGIFIGQSAFGTLREWYAVSLFACTTLIVLPAIFYFGIMTLGLIPAQHFLSILEAAMPLGVTPFALADKYDLDKNFIARSIVLSTALSIITLSVWITFLQ
jgi:predicted permease